MERRQFARIPVSMHLRFKSLEAVEKYIGGQANDVSQGGIFILTPNVRPVGTRVEMEISDSGGREVKLTGEVRSIRYSAGKPSGMGIEFTGLGREAQKLVQELVDFHRRQNPVPNRAAPKALTK